MPLPTTKEVESALLILLYLNGGPLHQMASSDTYQPLADQFQLSEADRVRTRRFPDGRYEPEWNNKVQWAREGLRRDGMIDQSAPRGVWKLSETGVLTGVQLIKDRLSRVGNVQAILPVSDFDLADDRDATPESLPDVEELNLTVVEGEKKLITHFRRERNTAIVAAKKRHAQITQQGLSCEACGFDFRQVYGERGYGFCEVHHTKPLADEDREVETSLSDLAILCSNCHRMIHRTPMLTVGELREVIMHHRQNIDD